MNPRQSVKISHVFGIKIRGKNFSEGPNSIIIGEYNTERRKSASELFTNLYSWL